MESWRRVWRDGVAPQFTRQQLETLLWGLETDDQRLLQGVTTSPPPLLCVQDWPCEGACLISYPVAFETTEEIKVGEVEEQFAQMCFQADQTLGEPGAIRYLLRWFDESPRADVRRELIAEVKLALENHHHD